MSRTRKDRAPRPHQRGGRWPDEIPFDYVPSGVPVTADPADRVGQLLADPARATTDTPGQAHVRALLAAVYPGVAAALNDLVDNSPAAVWQRAELTAIANGWT